VVYFYFANGLPPKPLTVFGPRRKPGESSGVNTLDETVESPTTAEDQTHTYYSELTTPTGPGEHRPAPIYFDAKYPLNHCGSPRNDGGESSDVTLDETVGSPTETKQTLTYRSDFATPTTPQSTSGQEQRE
jgi:hypothetical protein